MSLVWKSCRRLALPRHLAGVFPKRLQRSWCVKCHHEQSFPLTKQRGVTLLTVRSDKDSSLSATTKWSPQKEKALKVIFRGTGKKKNTFCWLSVCALRDDWLIYNVVIFKFFFWTAVPSASLRASKDNAHHQGRVAYEQKDKLNTSTINMSLYGDVTEQSIQKK